MLRYEKSGLMKHARFGLVRDCGRTLVRYFHKLRGPILLLTALTVFLGVPSAWCGEDDKTYISLDDFLVTNSAWINGHRGDLGLKVLETSLTSVPFIDLYSPSGISVFHGEDPTGNAAFLRALPSSAAGMKKAGSFRPTLKEAIEMIPSLRAHEQRLLSGGKYTLFAVTYPNSRRCFPQNRAVDELRLRAQKVGMRLIEVEVRVK